MKGVILAGGLGTRLSPLTDVTNKHLLPVHDKPMLYYGLELMAKIGVGNVMVVTGDHSTGEILRLCGDGSKFGLHRLYYSYQQEPNGIAGALALAEEFVNEDFCCVLLGDNLFGDHELLKQLVSDCRPWFSAGLVVKKVPDFSQYGCLDARANHIVEKPANILQAPLLYPSCYKAVLGFYVYPWDVFEVIRTLKPSARGELEITDVNNVYLSQNRVRLCEYTDWWGDAGESVEALYRVSEMVRTGGAV